MIKQLKRVIMANQFAWATSALMLCIFCFLWGLIKDEINKNLLRSAEKGLIDHAEKISEQLDLFHTNLQQKTNQQSDIFIRQFPNKMHIDGESSDLIENHNSPALIYDEKVVNNDFDKPDLFTRLTGGSATIFMRIGDDFIRVSTSLRTESGNRALGTYLGKKHPGYNKLIKGDEYNGPAVLFGRYHMTKYVPLKDEFGNVIGVLYVGFDYTERFNALKQSLLELRVDDNQTTYFPHQQRVTTQFISNYTKEGESSDKPIATLLQALALNDKIAHFQIKDPNDKIINKMLVLSKAKKWDWGAVLVIRSWLKPSPLIITLIEYLLLFSFSIYLNYVAFYFKNSFFFQHLSPFFPYQKKQKETEVFNNNHITKIVNVMEQEKLYRIESYTISDLSKHVHLQDYKVRKIIKKGLGYRNFNDFLNHYRITEAAEKLSSPNYIGTPILTIAMECGYKAISSFNKAFKETYKVTPTEFRRKVMKNTNENQSLRND